MHKYFFKYEKIKLDVIEMFLYYSLNKKHLTFKGTMIYIAFIKLTKKDIFIVIVKRVTPNYGFQLGAWQTPSSKL